MALCTTLGPSSAIDDGWIDMSHVAYGAKL